MGKRRNVKAANLKPHRRRRLPVGDGWGGLARASVAISVAIKRRPSAGLLPMPPAESEMECN